jgi:uroporphyrinogen-III synthase
MGPSTAAAARAAGLKVALVAADHSLSGMVDALQRHLEQDV